MVLVELLHAPLDLGGGLLLGSLQGHLQELRAAAVGAQRGIVGRRDLRHGIEAADHAGERGGVGRRGLSVVGGDEDALNGGVVEAGIVEQALGLAGLADAGLGVGDLARAGRRAGEDQPSDQEEPERDHGLGSSS